MITATPAAIASAIQLGCSANAATVSRLAAMLSEAREACEQGAADHGCEVELRYLWSIPPIPFDDRLIALARRSVVDSGGKDTAIPSGPLHDAAEMARLIPRVAIEAYGRTVAGALELAAAGDLPPRE